MAGGQYRRDVAFPLAWNTVRTRKSFSYADLEVSTGISHRSARQYVREWICGGLVEFSHLKGKRKIFNVVRAEVQIPARYTPDGVMRREQTVEGNLWIAMRSLRTFTPTDLIATSNTPECRVSEKDALGYCKTLAEAGYLRVVRQEVKGRREAAYRVMRDTGPQPPQQHRVKAVYDSNLAEFTHVEGGLK